MKKKPNYSPVALARRKKYQRDYARKKRRTLKGKLSAEKAWHKYHVRIGTEARKYQIRKSMFNFRLRQLEADAAEVERLIKKGCAICGKTNKYGPKGKRILCLDHDHDTGLFRGILCNGCNTALGQFRDDPNLVEKALNYLRGII